MRTSPDWAAIEVAYRASRKPTREIARIDGSVTETAIRKRAKKEGWERPEPEPEIGRVLPTPPAERDMTFVAAEPRNMQSDSGSLVDKGRGLILALMAELEVENANIHMLAELVEIETAEDRGPHRRRILEKALSLPTRTQSAKNLATALATLRDAEPGKKEQREDAAREASRGRFATPQAPKLVVDNR